MKQKKRSREEAETYWTEWALAKAGYDRDALDATQKAAMRVTFDARPKQQWAIYDHPSDYPNTYVARMYHGPQRTDTVLTAASLSFLRKQMLGMGLTCIPRSPDDYPEIVEMWV